MANLLVDRLRQLADLRRVFAPPFPAAPVRDPVLEAEDLPSLAREHRLEGRGT